MLRKLCVLVWLATVPAVATATPVRIYAGAENPGSPYVTIHAPGMLGNGLQVMVGSVRFSGDLGTFDGYCVDINHYFTPNGWYMVDPVDSMANWGVNDPSVRSTSSPADAGHRAAYLYNTFGNTTDPLRRWALQTAIWNALYDDDSDITEGAFWLSTDYIAGVGVANAMLQALAQYSGPPMEATWLRLVDDANRGTQDFIAPVPEISSVLLVATGLGVLIVRSDAVGRAYRRVAERKRRRT